MKNIVLYETKKLLKAKSAVILCILLAVFNIVISFFGVPSENAVAQEKYDKVAANVIYTAKVNLSQIVDKESESALYQKDIIARFERLQESVKVAPVMGFDSLLTSPYPYLSALIFSAYAAIYLALSEHSANLVLLSCKQKRVRVALSKLAVLTLCALGSVLLFCISYALGTLFAVGFSGALAPVQSIMAYIRCPYGINVLTAVVLRVAFSFAAALFASFLVHLAALTVKKIIPALVCVIAFIGADYILADAAGQDIFSLFYNFNFRVLICGEYLARYSGMKVGVFVIQPYIILAVVLFGTAFFGLLSLLLFRFAWSIKNVVAKRARGKKGEACGKSLGFYEMKKLFRGKTVIVVLILVVFKAVALNMQVKAPNSDYENIYKYYLAEMDDMGYNTQVAYITSETEKCKEFIIEAEEYMNAYMDDREDDHSKFLEYSTMIGLEELKLSVLSNISLQLSQLSVLANKGIDAKLIYTTGWDKLFSLDSDIFCILTIVFILIPYIIIDEEERFVQIYNSVFVSRKKDKMHFISRKNIRIFLVSIFITLVFSAIDILFIHYKIGLPSWNEYAVGTVLDTQVQTLFLWQIVVFRMIVSFFGISLVILTCNIISKYISNGTLITAIFILFEAVCMLVTQLADIFFVLDFTSFWGYGIFSCDGQTLFVEFMILLGISIIFYVRNRILHNRKKLCKIVD